MAAYSGASQIIFARQCWHPGNKTLPDGIVARTSNFEIRPSWNSVMNNRISKHPSNLSAIVGVKKKEILNKIVAKGVAAKPLYSNAPQIKYDVFVSFRGEDIRHSFLGHLIKAFHQKQIIAFVDDKLKRGDDISSSLLEAVEESFISLIVFSENYASSRWCLEELVKIMECKEKYGQVVIPVFYEIDPTDVRHQKKSYEKAITEHERKYEMPQVQIWRHALSKSANLAGIKSSDFRDETELLEEMINLVLTSLSKNPVTRKRLIGIHKPMAHLESLLQKESKMVLVLGIWGMGGIGKTTIAEEVFNQNHSKYEGCCFLAVNEELRRHGMTSLKEKLFSTLLGEVVKIDTPNGLSNYIEKRIGRMKVLIVLDDVSDTDILERLFGTLDWIRSDSRIIVTTRNRQVLIANRVGDIFEVGILNSSEALELFNLNAFNQSHVEMKYYELSKKVVNYAKGIPLVLKVLGHLLCGKGKEVWESQLDRLKKMPSKRVHDVLRLSYDDLDRVEQKIFLDIACFFNGLNFHVSQIEDLLKDCESDNSVAVGLERLKDRALITISEDYVVCMHDIIQEMGREIVRQESSEDPGSRSRLWDPDDIFEVLNYSKGTEAIRSIRADMSAIRKLKLSPHVFAKMSNLKFLDFHDKYDEDCLDQDYLDIFPQGLQYLPNGLRFVRWKHYPLKSFPKEFSAENLVMLELLYSRVEMLWCGVQNLVNLKEVHLIGSKFLKELPDFSKASNLEVLNLRYCYHLISVHPSIFSLDKLEELDLSSCNSLTLITVDIHLSSLRYLSLANCQSPRRFWVAPENTIEPHQWDIRVNALPSYKSKLEVLVLIGTRFEGVPSWIKNQTRLRVLDLRFCSKIRALAELPSSLEIILVDECNSLETVWFPSSAVEHFSQNRKRVEFWNCLKLDERSLRNIALNAEINLMRYTYQHISGIEHDYVEYRYYFIDNYHSNQAVYVYPGSSVPKWFEYKTMKAFQYVDISIAQLSPPLGFIFCFILSTGSGNRDRIELNVTTIDGEGNVEKGYIYIYMNGSCFVADTDHVCIIYDPPSSCYLSSRVKHQTRFKIRASRNEEIDISQEGLEGHELELKGFGVSIVNPSTYLNFIQQMGII